MQMERFISPHHQMELSVYMAQFENYYAVNNVKAEKKVSHILANVGHEMFA